MIFIVEMNESEPKIFEDVTHEEVTKDGMQFLEITHDEDGRIESIPRAEIKKYYETANGNVIPF